MLLLPVDVSGAHNNMTQLLTRAKLTRATTLIRYFPHSNPHHHRHCSPKSPCALTHFKDTSTTPNPEHGSNTITVTGAEKSQAFEKAGKELKEQVPEVLRSERVVKLACKSTAKGGSCDVYLVGTTHWTLECPMLVEEVIKAVKPEIVFLELCPGYNGLLHRPTKFPKAPVQSMAKMWKNNHHFAEVLFSYLKAKSKFRRLRKLGFYPRSEWCAAYEEARKYGAKVILGDRPIEITRKRAWANLSLLQKAKLLLSGFCFGFYHFPNARRGKLTNKFFIDERDQYMSALLLKSARKRKRVVGVVGRAHLRGIQKHWKQPVDMKDLLTIPPLKPVLSWKILVSVVVSMAGTAIIGYLP